MAQYRIICTNQQPSGVPNDRAHIVGVGTGPTSAQYTSYWTLQQVLNAMDQGDTFYTYGENSRKSAWVHKYVCPNCTRTHIRSAPDAVRDNNLDNLSTCKIN